MFVAAFLGNRIRALFHKNKPTKEVAEKEHPKLLELWNKYGTIGLGFIVTVSVGAPISLAVGAGLNANFKKLKKLVTSEPIETKEVTKFFVNRKIKELKPK